MSLIHEKHQIYCLIGTINSADGCLKALGGHYNILICVISEWVMRAILIFPIIKSDFTWWRVHCFFAHLSWTKKRKEKKRRARHVSACASSNDQYRFTNHLRARASKGKWVCSFPSFLNRHAFFHSISAIARYLPGNDACTCSFVFSHAISRREEMNMLMVTTDMQTIHSLVLHVRPTGTGKTDVRMCTMLCSSSAYIDETRQ